LLFTIWNARNTAHRISNWIICRTWVWDQKTAGSATKSGTALQLAHRYRGQLLDIWQAGT